MVEEQGLESGPILYVPPRQRRPLGHESCAAKQDQRADGRQRIKPGAVTAADTADLARLRRRIETEAFTHARTALDNPSLPIRLDLAVGNATISQVH
ncbi:MAG: hypothetical protein ABJA87_00010 [bacterium]